MYVDHAFSISDEDMMMETSYTANNKPPIKEIALAVALLVFGTLGIIIGSLMAYHHVGGDTAHGNLTSTPFFPFNRSLPNSELTFTIDSENCDLFIIRNF